MVNNKPKLPAWQDNFRSSCLKVGLHIGLTRAMVEFLSAVADGVCWDRSKYGSAAAFPDNFLATSRSLAKRGLIESKAPDEIEANKQRRDIWEWTHWRLTEAGEHVVALLKLAGVFVEADAAIDKKARKEARA